jgi:predicted nucleotidyltransferase
MKRDEIIKALRRFKEGNQQRYRIEKIGIFGSSARGDMKTESDIDVVVVLEKQDLFNLIGIKQDLEDQFGVPVDIVSYREKMNKYLKRRIEDEVLYA